MLAFKILIAIGAILLMVGVYAFIIEPRRLSEKHYLIRKNKERVLDISEASEMFELESEVQIAHISDLHFSRWFKPRRLKKTLRSLREAKPDMIVFTGDLIDDYKKWPVRQTKSLILALKQMQAPLGKVAVLGNHDYKSDGAGFVKEVLESAGFTVLINQELFGSNEEISLSVAGVADPSTKNAQYYYEATLAQWQLLLLHQPDYISQVKNLSMYDLVLSGHSHGGQIRLPKYYPKTDGAKTFTDSLYLPKEETLLSVNTGIGTTHLPLRFGVPPEVIYYHLSSKTEAFPEYVNPFDFKALIKEEKAKKAANKMTAKDTLLPVPTAKTAHSKPNEDKIVDMSLFRRRYHQKTKKRTVS